MNKFEYNSRVEDAMDIIKHAIVITANVDRNVIVIQWQYDNKPVDIYTLDELEEMASNISNDRATELFVFDNREDAEKFYNELEREMNVPEN